MEPHSFSLGHRVTGRGLWRWPCCYRGDSWPQRGYGPGPRPPSSGAAGESGARAARSPHRPSLRWDVGVPRRSEVSERQHLPELGKPRHGWGGNWLMADSRVGPSAGLPGSVQGPGRRQSSLSKALAAALRRWAHQLRARLFARPPLSSLGQQLALSDSE